MDSPSVNGIDEIHPALSPSNTTIPVTPDVSDRGSLSYVQSPAQILEPHRQAQWNCNSYFVPNEWGEIPDSPARVATGARTSGELLRRLSLVDSDRPAIHEVDPRTAFPSLNLSGGIISATFCIPHSVGFQSGQEWVSKLPQGR